MKIISNKKYEFMINEIETLKVTIKIKDDNLTHQENIKKILDKNLKNAKAEICDLKIKLDDLNGFLEQEKQVSNHLRKERSYLRRLLTKNGIKYKKEERKKENENNNVCE